MYIYEYQYPFLWPHVCIWLCMSLVSFAKEPYKRDDILQKRPVYTHFFDIVRVYDYVCLGSLLQKSPIKEMLFCKRDLYTPISLTLCVYMTMYVFDTVCVYMSFTSSCVYMTMQYPFLWHVCVYDYGVAVISRLLKIIGLFCKRAL